MLFGMADRISLKAAPMSQKGKGRETSGTSARKINPAPMTLAPQIQKFLGHGDKESGQIQRRPKLAGKRQEQSPKKMKLPVHSEDRHHPGSHRFVPMQTIHCNLANYKEHSLCCGYANIALKMVKGSSCKKCDMCFYTRYRRHEWSEIIAARDCSHRLPD